ncbi:4'-phosphopantetheinyl transferase family protein [Niallia taxi]|uniref:4'-phosphopantetheinyl transferase family protein n=1 Tax=Niallia taxi TaxID=2499688 RepID=UPI0021A8E6A8|nr:4'-phosphopantetheinyl transferase superfamily protein [Niallia taxi]MCT2347286.1 4'-phosphopantetheinyl transferase superfamily protein [Niallia taxi]MED3961502.1 4'-phosphopantetheinyl transferase superfamily protein [Niallia taxi]
MSDIFCVKINEYLDPSVFDKLRDLLPLDKRIKLEKYRHFADAQRGLFSDLLIRYIIRKKGFSSGEIIFEINSYGKPSFKKIPHFEFNISHSGDWVVCAVDQSPVGIDVELVNTIDIDLAYQFFTEKECEYIFSSNENRLFRFYEIWTLKESYIKAVGQGLTIPLNSFSIYKQNTDFSVDTENSKDFFNYLRLIKLDPAYKLAVCSNYKDISDCLVLVSQAELVEFTLKEINQE